MKRMQFVRAPGSCCGDDRARGRKGEGVEKRIGFNMADNWLCSGAGSVQLCQAAPRNWQGTAGIGTCLRHVTDCRHGMQ